MPTQQALLGNSFRFSRVMVLLDIGLLSRIQDQMAIVLDHASVHTATLICGCEIKADVTASVSYKFNGQEINETSPRRSCPPYIKSTGKLS